MNITGIVAEYNPFHKGHEYQLNKAREKSKCEGIAVVMSGNYVQRGEPAIIDKYKRAEAAIYGGADLVIELPMPYSCQNAELFALGAISELKKLSISTLSFGCENDDTKLLVEIAKTQINNKMYNQIFKKEISKGISYPTAVTNALKHLLGKKIDNIIKSPNNILGIEYIKSCIKINLNCEIFPIKRIGKGYNDLNINGYYDSASAIRRSILMDKKKIDLNSLTDISIEALHKFYEMYGGFNSLDNYLNYIYYKILILGLDGLNNIYEVSEGLNNKIYSNVLKYVTVDDFIKSLKSKRYTYSKIRRILLNILLEIQKSDIRSLISQNLYNNNKTNYIKVLAFNDIGRKIIKETKNNGTYIINRYSDYKKNNINIEDTTTFKLTDKATNIYYIPFNNAKINEEYYLNAIYVK